MFFLNHFSQLEGPRSNTNKKHDFPDILFLVVSAVLSGAQGWEGIVAFGKIKIEWLRKFRPFTCGVSGNDTLARVIGALKPDAFIDCFIY